MRGCGSALLAALVGAVIGAIVISVLGWQVMSARYPGFSTDGQSGMIFLLTVPGGGLLGAIIGFGYGWWRARTGA